MSDESSPAEAEIEERPGWEALVSSLREDLAGRPREEAQERVDHALDLLRESMRFESFVTVLSAELAAAAPAELDAAITKGLRELASFLRLERAFLARLREGRLSITHHWLGEGLAPVRRDFLTEVNPADYWVASECLAGRTISFTSANEFPEEAAADRRHFEEQQLASTAWVPGILGSNVVGCVIMDSFSPDPGRDWTPQVVDRLRVPVELLFWATARSEAASEIERRSRFDELLIRVSTSLVEATEQMDERIEAGLGEICRHLGMSLATVLLHEPETGAFRHTHEWPSKDKKFQDVDVTEASFPWIFSRMTEEQPIVWSRADQPPGMTAERETAERHGLETVVWVPYHAGEAGRGFVAFNSTRHLEVTDRLVAQFAVVGELIGHSLNRQRVENDLRTALMEIEKLKARFEADYLYLRDEVRSRQRAGEIVGNSPALVEVLEQASQVAETDSTVLILGETGTGKELLARFIHQHSGRSQRPLVTVNCGALPETLVETELFGHERGAYTGALSRQIGRFETADGSTIFLDEVADLPLDSQVKLLRILQDGEFERLGSSKTRSVDVRVIAATNRNPEQAVREKRLREDLYYRLNVFPITVPPLRERPEDIPELTWSFIREFAGAMGKSVETVPRKAMERLTRYSWPGNVRELRNVVERAMIVCPGTVLEIPTPATAPASEAADADVTRLDEVQRRHILAILERTRWRLRGKMGAAELLGMKPSTLEYRMKKLGIERPR